MARIAVARSGPPLWPWLVGAIGLAGAIWLIDRVGLAADAEIPAPDPTENILLSPP
ncbi:MAG: hypothetical protein ACRELD_07320 [Longimicrobiales bacterium]